jgi:hypothetical protein
VVVTASNAQSVAHRADVPLDHATALATAPFQSRPDAPFRGTLALDRTTIGPLIIQLQDSAGHVLLTHFPNLDP